MAAVSFEDLLNEHVLESDPLPPPRRATARPRPGTAAAYGFFFVDIRPETFHDAAPRDTPACRADASAQPLRRCVASPAPAADGGRVYAACAKTPATGRPARRLSLRQREALAVLHALGAPLSADFTADQLRAAFRTLARRYHPDRHPRCTDHDRARLCLLFGHAHDAYRVLSGDLTSL